MYANDHFMPVDEVVVTHPDFNKPKRGFVVACRLDRAKQGVLYLVALSDKYQRFGASAVWYESDCLTAPPDSTKVVHKYERGGELPVRLGYEVRKAHSSGALVSYDTSRYVVERMQIPGPADWIYVGARGEYDEVLRRAELVVYADVYIRSKVCPTRVHTWSLENVRTVPSFYLSESRRRSLSDLRAGGSEVQLTWAQYPDIE